MARNRLFVAIIVAAAVVGGAAGVNALEQEGFTLSDATPKVHRDYPPIPAQNPSGTLGDPTLDDCRDLPSHALISIRMKFRKDFGHVATFDVSWQAAEANDVDIYFFDEEGEVIADSATSDHPERVRLGSLANGQYYLCVANFSGPNAGFVLDASVRYVELYSRTPSPAEATPRPTPTRAPARVTPQPGTEKPKVPVVTAEPVATLGPDGPLTDQKLTAVAGRDQAAPPSDELGVAQIVFAVLTGVIVVAGAALVVLRIRRDTGA